MILSKREQSFFNAAAAMSVNSEHRCQVGCIVVNKHRIISSGYNGKFKGCSLQKRLDNKYFKDNHSMGRKYAEIDALLPLIKSKHDLSKATLYIYRKNRHGQLTLARPCPRCMSVIKECGIRRLKYTTDDGYASEVIKYDSIS